LIKTEAFENGRFHTQFLNTENIEKICKQSCLDVSHTQPTLTSEELGAVAAVVIQKLQSQKQTTSTKNNFETNNWKAQQWR
jgi:hypothetical protein